MCAQPSRWARAHERVRRSLSRSRAPGRWGTKLYSSTLAPLVQCRSSARLTLDTCTGTMRDPGEAWGTRSGWSTSSDVALSSISVGSPHAHTHVPPLGTHEKANEINENTRPRLFFALPSFELWCLSPILCQLWTCLGEDDEAAPDVRAREVDGDDGGAHRQELLRRACKRGSQHRPAQASVRSS